MPFKRIKKMVSKIRKPKRPLTMVELSRKIAFLEARVKELDGLLSKETPVFPLVRVPGTVPFFSPTTRLRNTAFRALQKARAQLKKLDSNP
jgi:hypothetical protein